MAEPVTGLWVFERAMALMDTGDGASGRLDTGENRPYRHRSPSILNILGTECARYSALDSWKEIAALEEPLGLETGLTQGVLPYGLAAHLLLEEDPAAASFFQQRYEELLQRWRRDAGAGFELIDLPYGGLCPGGWC